MAAVVISDVPFLNWTEPNVLQPSSSGSDSSSDISSPDEDFLAKLRAERSSAKERPAAAVAREGDSPKTARRKPRGRRPVAR